MDDLMGYSTQTALEKELGENYRYYECLKGLQDIKGIQARLPFDHYIELIFMKKGRP